MNGASLVAGLFCRLLRIQLQFPRREEGGHLLSTCTYMGMDALYIEEANLSSTVGRRNTHNKEDD